MALKNYGVLKGRPIARRLGAGTSPHYQVHLVDDDADIHMNQGNAAEFRKDNGVWQDGGLLLHLPSENRWVAVFLAFQSQCWHTGDVKGDCLGAAGQPAEERGVVIIAAAVNPAGHDPGMEKVLLLNTLTDAEQGRTIVF
jgi:uncharacterized protein YukJ